MMKVRNVLSIILLKSFSALVYKKRIIYNTFGRGDSKRSKVIHYITVHLKAFSLSLSRIIYNTFEPATDGGATWLTVGNTLLLKSSPGR